MEQFKFHIGRLRVSGLRPTKQRLAICKILFDRKETFHFTIEKLKQITEKDSKKKISFFLQNSQKIAFNLGEPLAICFLTPFFLS